MQTQDERRHAIERIYRAYEAQCDTGHGKDRELAGFLAGLTMMSVAYEINTEAAIQVIEDAAKGVSYAEQGT